MTDSVEVLAERIRALESRVTDNRTNFQRFIEAEYEPLAKRVDGFVNFQKLLTMLWTGIVFSAGLAVGVLGLHKR